MQGCMSGAYTHVPCPQGSGEETWYKSSRCQTYLEVCDMAWEEWLRASTGFNTGRKLIHHA